MSDTSEPAPGWYPDPAAPTWSLRYWDGAQWTDRTTPRPRSPATGEVAGGSGEQEAGAGEATGKAQTGEGQTGGEQSGPVGPGAGDQAAQRSGVPLLGLPLPPAPQQGPPPGWGSGAWQPVVGTPAAYLPTGGPPEPTGAPPGPADGPPADGASWRGLGQPRDGAVPPAPRRRAGRRGRARLVTLVSLAVAAIVYFVLPTGPPKNPGTTWFRGGVPGWDDVSLRGWSAQDGSLVHAWAVPGPRFGPDRPFLAVARLVGVVPVGQSARAVLEAEQAAMMGSSSVTDARLVDLDDGSPGLLWTNPDRLNAAPNVPLTDYSLFALRGGTLYGVFFETTSAAFAGERQGVRRVMLSFKGTGH